MPAKLIPPDKNRCQSETLSGSFMTLGPREMVRCKRKPKVIAKENRPGEDGRRGSMSLCAECMAVFITQLGEHYATFRKIKP